ncbi:DUF2206 domain-containing protein [Kitasatospora sp. NPDC085895]|uniref:DUF2206 domain-containing protein n=1 Tax=Kitasatospora sp. NPDC085895 TaxID=3155057 RepID=UPI00344B2F0C
MTARALLPHFRGRTGVVLGSALACVVEMLPGVPGAVATAAGLWLLVGAPVALWRGTAAMVVSTREAGLMVAVGLAVVTDILIALGVNTLLPLFGADQPLTRINLAGASGMAAAVLGAFLPEEERPAARRRTCLPHGTAALACLAGLALVLSVAGPVRLNNGLGGAVSTLALVAVAVLLLLLMLRRRKYPPPLLAAGLYTAAAALLLMNSLRGWGIAGHDIQREYEYFRLTLGGSYWNVELYPDAYNACLSVTLLPLSFTRLTAIPDVYVFKVVLPLLFALTPVLVHRAVRNVAPQFTALLAAVYFMLFPTFFTDMTFLGRQEIAFLLLGCAMAVLTDTARPLRARRLAVLALLVGCVLSHYSTTYVVVATLGVAYAVELLWRLAGRGRRQRRRSRVAKAEPVVTWWLVLVPAVLAVVWAGPVTHTSVQLKSTLGIVVQEILHPGQGKGGSSDTSYSLFGGTKASPQQRLDDYRAETVEATESKRAAGDFFPLQSVEGQKMAAVTQEDMPLTALGRALDTAGVSVTGLNGALRQGAALLLQVLVVVGLAAVLRARRRAFRPLRDQVTLTVGALAMVALFTLLPQLSVDYSVLRAFQQGLFFFAPFLAAGTLWLLRWAGRRTVPVAAGLAVALFLDLTGVVPKVLGGYPAQLQLSNAGRAYDIYYPHAEEEMAVFWLEQQIAADKRQLLQTDRFTFSRLQTLITGPAEGDIQPVLVRPNSYVLLGTTSLRKDEVTVFYRGDLITYKYPTALLGATKNRIYSSEGAVIYR